MGKAKKLLEKARAFNQDKAWQKCIDALPDAELETLKSADLYAEKAQAHYRLKQFAKSKIAAEKALLINAEHAKASHYLGNWHSDQKDYDKAIEWYQKAIQFDPNFAYPYNGLGNEYADQKDYDKAIEWYQKAIQIDPNDAAPYHGLGNVFGNKKDQNKAIEWYQKAIQIDPNYAYSYYGLGNVYADKKDNDKAIECYQKAIQIDPNDAAPYNGLGNVYNDKKDYDQAIEWYQKAIQIDANYSYPYNGLGNAYKNKKGYDQAIDWYQKAIQIDPDYNAPHYNLGLALKELGKQKDAKAALEKYLDLTPDKDGFFYKQAQANIVELEKLLAYGDYYDTISRLTTEVKDLLRVQGSCITHYTSLSAARYLILMGSKFRLSEGAFLNDTSEGRELFRYLNFNINTPNHHETIAERFSKKPFIGSFVDEKKHDDLTLWRMYGKEDKEEARGCSITMDMKRLIELLKEEIQGKSATSGNRDGIALMDKEFVFYQVAYHEKETNDFLVPGAEPEKNERLNQLMRNLAKAVEEFNMHKKKHAEEQRDAIELLNEIAFLFKTVEYQYEHEIRLVIEKTGFDVKFNKPEELPKAYIEIADIRKAITKITLGPKIDRAAEWAAVFYYSLQKDGLKPDIFISHLPFK